MQGLYKNDEGILMYAQYEVSAPDYYLNASEKQEGHGWLWFETRQEALDYFGITEIEKDLNII
jgi:hypothetical protein